MQSEQFYIDLDALVSKYRPCDTPGYATLCALNLAHYRGHIDRLNALDNTAHAMEREYLHQLFQIPEPCERIAQTRCDEGMRVFIK